MKKGFQQLTERELMSTNGGESSSWYGKIVDIVSKFGNWLWP